MNYVIVVKILINSVVNVKSFEFKTERDRRSFINDINKIQNVISYATTEINQLKKGKNEII